MSHRGRSLGVLLALTVLVAGGLAWIEVRDGETRVVELEAPPDIPAGQSARAPLWAAVNEGGTANEPLSGTEDAAQLDMISAAPGAYVGQVGDMQQVNPDLRLLAYLNGALAQSDQGTTYPRDWYARDAEGQLIRSQSFQNLLMEVWNPGWQRERARRCLSIARASGYQGCMVDVLGLAPLVGGYLSAPPVNPETGSPWLDHQWLHETSGLAATIKHRVGDEYDVIVNGLGNGEQFFDVTAPTSRLLDAADGGVAESWLRWPGASADSCSDRSQFDADLRMLDTADEIDKDILVLTKLWTDADGSDRERWEMFTFATFLLGMNDHTYLSFSPMRGADPAVVPSLLTTDVGVPLTERVEIEGVLVRHFSGVTAIVNPGRGSARVVLPEGFTSLDGDPTTEVELEECEALIVRRDS